MVVEAATSSPLLVAVVDTVKVRVAASRTLPHVCIAPGRLREDGLAIDDARTRVRARLGIGTPTDRRDDRGGREQRADRGEDCADLGRFLLELDVLRKIGEDLAQLPDVL